MSLDYVKFSPGFESFMPKEYRDMVEHGPFGKKTTVSQMGSFKEILEGKHDDLPEGAFYMVGTIDDAVAKAATMKD